LQLGVKRWVALNDTGLLLLVAGQQLALIFALALLTVSCTRRPILRCFIVVAFLCTPVLFIGAQLISSEALASILLILLIAIASVSLIVGGIGIMNVMLVSVTERTREIGVRVAVGATEEAIQLQFLGEAIMLSLVGGGVGVFFGIFGSYLIGQTLHWPMQMSVESVLVAAMFSIAVGVFFGYYPARKASRLDPIEALHYE